MAEVSTMKAKTFIELAALSANLYAISRETHLMDKLKELSDQGRDKINEFMSEKSLDKDGNEIPFTERVRMRAKEVQEEMEEKMREMVAAFYEKVNITHTDKLVELERKLEELNNKIALAEERINQIENKG